MAADAVYGFNVSPHVNFLSENLYRRRAILKNPS